MSFNFDKMTDRRHSNSYKWDVADNELPMWVADMDFETAPVVTEALRRRVDHGIFGYNTVPASFGKSIAAWWRRRHSFHIEQDWLLYCTGVVPAISAIVRKMTAIGDQIVVLSPVYNIFYNSILNNQRKVLASPLLYKEGIYEIDFADLEEKLSLKDTTLFIFCNPHNPIGKVWQPEILQKVGELCIKHNVLLISDEIHCDLTHPNTFYTPMAAISKEIAQQTITCIAPTKTFNLAGLQTSAIVIPNPEIRSQVERGINTDEVAEPNSFAIQAAEAAFNDGEEWLEDLRIYLYKNKEMLMEFIKERLPEIQVVASEATYLAWLDCSKVTNNTDELCVFIRQQTGLYLSPGDIFGGNGHCFIRWNYACPKSRLMDGLQRFEKALKLY